MKLFLLRHGAAEPRAAQDRDRRLTASGREELRHVLSQSSEELATVEHVAISPYVRTRETFQIAQEYLPEGVRCEIEEMLTPSGSPSEVIRWLGRSSAQSVLLVTHQPLVGALLDDLCGFESGLYRMGTGAMAFVETDMPAIGLAEFRWLRQV